MCSAPAKIRRGPIAVLHKGLVVFLGHGQNLSPSAEKGETSDPSSKTYKTISPSRVEGRFDLEVKLLHASGSELFRLHLEDECHQGDRESARKLAAFSDSGRRRACAN